VPNALLLSNSFPISTFIISWLCAEMITKNSLALRAKWSLGDIENLSTNAPGLIAV
jgi:hypothetical protein